MSVWPTTPMRRSMVLISFLSLVSALLILTSGLVSVMLWPRSSMLPLTSSKASCTLCSSCVSEVTFWLVVWYTSVAPRSLSCSPLYSSARCSKWVLMYFSLATSRSSMLPTSLAILLSALVVSGSTSWMVFSCVMVCSRCARHSLPAVPRPLILRRGATRSSSVRHAIGSTVASSASRPLDSSSSLPSSPLPLPRASSSYMTSSSSSAAASSSTSPTTSASSSTSASSAKSSSGYTGLSHWNPCRASAWSHRKLITRVTASPCACFSFCVGKSISKPICFSSSIILLTLVLGSSYLSVVNSCSQRLMSHLTSSMNCANCRPALSAGNAK
mmetsp:Transcript_34248/g.95561  ORF Transcript_34248/g.95561 Transcript_34248/m.95561 type:complete len:329 (-) Transcript_34248:193-1179(-)